MRILRSSRRDPLAVAPASGIGEEDWVLALSLDGPVRDAALTRLHGLLLRAARHQVWRMRAQLGTSDPDRIEEIAAQAADEAMVALLSKLHTFQGRSRFTTWAYKFAVFQAANEVRSEAWRSRDVPLDDGVVVVDLEPSAEQYAEAKDLAHAAKAAIEEALTPHQRSVVLALLVDEVPIDVLAERLGTNRNALYKTLHDARVRVRGHLAEAGFLTAATEGRGRR